MADVATDTGSATGAVDVTACDREPIHIPGAIQPHGLLLVADAATGAVIAGAGDLEGAFGDDWLGRPLDALLGHPVAAAPAGAPGEGAWMPPVAARDGRYAVSLHRSGDRLLAELEPADATPESTAAMFRRLNAMAAGFERATDLDGLCARAAIAFRQLTGFDRVMIYRFLDDDAGRVVAEDRAPGLGSFLHHHFPASDIPQQARALYVRNRARVIPDIAYIPAPLRPAAFAATDLSDIAIRSVSPIHLRYLANMGVAASASVSIVKDGVLWGLVACHNDTPRRLSADLRVAATVLAGGLARQIRAREEAESYRERLRLRGAEDALLPKLAADATLAAIVGGLLPELRAMLGGDGFAFVGKKRLECDGIVPDADVVAEIAHWAKRRGEIVATDRLPAAFPLDPRSRAVASGLLALPLADDGAMLLWFRAEQPEEIEWAGNPHKAVSAQPGAMLNPRASFESWTETVRGRSRAWTLESVEAAHRLRRAFHDARQTQALRKLNRDLTRTLADKDALIAQKDVLMKEVDHRVQNSLQLVSSFLALQARSVEDRAVREHLTTAQARLAAVALVHRRLYRDDQVETVDLGRYLQELVDDVKASLGAEWAAGMRVDLSPVLIPTDRAVNVGLILTELVINATKYAYGGRIGPISVALEQHRRRFRLIVADEGGGRATGKSEGFGSRMMAAMVARLGGEIDYGDNAPGLRAILTAPIEDAPR